MTYLTPVLGTIGSVASVVLGGQPNGLADSGAETPNTDNKGFDIVAGLDE